MKDYEIYNQVILVGRLSNTPVKEFVKNDEKRIFTKLLLKTRFKNEIEVPLVAFGTHVDIICTKFKKGDVVAIKGQISTKENTLQIGIVATEVQLIKKTQIKEVADDQFRKIVTLYDPSNVTKRLKN